MFVIFLLLLTSPSFSIQRRIHDGVRRSRQLELSSPSTGDVDESEVTVQLPQQNNGQPSTSSALPPLVLVTPVRKTGVENKGGLCKPPFDVLLCKPKNNLVKSRSNALDEDVPKPSRDLIPPFNDVEEGSISKKTTEKAAGGKLTKRPHFSSQTSRNVVGESSKFTEGITKQTTADVPFLTNAEATNELRSYLPPVSEVPAAAQPSVSIVKPDRRENHHDHHHGHHGDNFDICADAFHSFLCAPLKARKRITGALPNQFSGQSSFVHSQKVLPSPERVPAPSNAVQNEYLPPKPTYSSASNRVDAIFTRAPPKPVPALPPLTFKAFPASTFAQTTKRPIITPPATTQSTTTPKAVSEFPSEPPTFVIQPTNEDRFYLPPKPNPHPAASFVSSSKQPLAKPSTLVLPTFRTVVSNIQPLPTVSTFIPMASNSVFLPIQPEAAPVLLTSTRLVSTTTTVKPSAQAVSTFIPLPVRADVFYSPPQTVFQPINFISTTAKPLTTKATSLPPKPVTNHSLQPKYQSSSNVISTTIKPFRPQFVEESTSEDRSYLPPEPNVQPAAAQIDAAVALPQRKNPFHHGRDLCTDPFHSFLCVGAKPRKRITGALPGSRPENINRNDLTVKPAASFTNENKVKPEPLEKSPSQSVGYQYPQPGNSLPTSTAAPTTGYSYPKPDKIFPLPSQQKEVAVPTKAEILKPAEARNPGYQYPKPEVGLPLPSGQDNKIATTAKPTTGYSYPKPEKPFPLPTEQKEIYAKEPKPQSSAATSNGYQYPKPQESFELPDRKGYSYPKPEKRLELPESQSTLFPENPKTEILGGSDSSAEFIPVNKLSKREETSHTFGEKIKKRERRL